MNISLPVPPSVQYAPEHAEAAVKVVRKVSKVDLDYSVQSLELLDKILDQMHSQGTKPEAVGGTLFAFGCYVGMVFVRNAGAVWRDADTNPANALFQFPLFLELTNGTFCNPIGKVFKRVEDGTEDYLPYFYQVFAGNKPPSDAQPRKKPWWKRA